MHETAALTTFMQRTGDRGVKQDTGGRSQGKTSAAAGILVVIVGTLGGWLLAASLLLSAPPTAQAGEVRGVHIRIAFPAEAGWDAVDIQMLLLVEHGEPFDELAEEARATALERFPGGVEVRPEVSGQFEKLGWSWQGNTTSWAYNPAGKPASLEGDAAIMRTAAETWNFAGGARFHFTGGGLTNAPATMCNGGRDGQNTVTWSHIGGSVLAMTCVPAQEPFDEFAIEFDSGRPWTTGTSGVVIDLKSVAIHEFGHALGLGHSNIQDAVMYPTYFTGQLKRSLHQDDIEGLIAIYGILDASPTPAPTATPVATPTPTTTPAYTPTPAATYQALVPALRRD